MEVTPDTTGGRTTIAVALVLYAAALEDVVSIVARLANIRVMDGAIAALHGNTVLASAGVGNALVAFEAISRAASAARLIAVLCAMCPCSGLARWANALERDTNLPHALTSSAFDALPSLQFVACFATFAHLLIVLQTIEARRGLAKPAATEVRPTSLILEGEPVIALHTSLCAVAAAI